MDPDETRSITVIILLLIFFVLKAYYSVCEYSVTEISGSKVKALAEKDKRYASLLELIANPRRMLTAFSVQRALSSVVISISSVLVFYSDLSNWFEKILKEFNSSISQTIAILIIALLTTLFIVVFTDALPRYISRSIKETFTLKCVASIKILIAVFTLFTNLINVITLGICRILRIPADAGKETVTEEEILMMVEEGNETGIIEESQREMINNIFEFNDSTVSEVMTHRTDLIAVEVNSKIAQLVYDARSEGFSRIPIYENSVDNIIGIIYIKDLLCLIGVENIEDFKINQFMRKPMYVPETSKCKDVFESMTLNKTQAAIVIDEYGGTAGIVTMEDLLEEIVGNIQDEYDDEEAEFQKIDEDVYMINGSADPDDILPKLNIVLPEEHNYDTMSGFFVDVLERIPEEDETPTIRYENVEMTALITEDNWVTKIKAKIIHENTNLEEED